MDDTLTLWETAARLALAMLGGAALGWEREVRDKPAGLRTHMMVALGAAVFMLVGMRLAAEVPGDRFPFDPLRVLQGIIGGVGFLGAGAIIQARGRVRGLTTAASIWLAAALGATSGIGYYDIAGLGAAFGLVVLLLVGFIERRYLEPMVKDDPEEPDAD